MKKQVGKSVKLLSITSGEYCINGRVLKWSWLRSFFGMPCFYVEYEVRTFSVFRVGKAWFRPSHITFSEPY